MVTFYQYHKNMIMINYYLHTVFIKALSSGVVVVQTSLLRILIDQLEKLSASFFRFSPATEVPEVLVEDLSDVLQIY